MLSIIVDDDTYYNVLSLQRNKIKVDKFEEYVKSKSTFDFYTEFQVSFFFINLNISNHVERIYWYIKQ